MIFVGDIAIPFNNAIDIISMPQDLLKQQWFGNLEGGIISNYNYWQNKKVVFNHDDSIKQLLTTFNFCGLALANNHINDSHTLNDTFLFLKEHNIKYCGAGLNLDNASKPIVVNDDGIEIVVLNYGWEVIQCKIANKNKIGVNPLEIKHVQESIKIVKNDYKDSKIVVYMHWGYELESEPQPSERELAKALIDLGASGIIGCHPHRIGGFELYKGCPIIYSLGNWMFKQRHYHNGRLEFPDFCNDELAFEWNFDTNDFYFHFFTYSKAESILTYAHTEGVNSEIMKQRTPFRDLTKDDYVKWYKNHHHHKGKGLPIYYWDDSNCNILIKNKINKFRDWLIKFVLGIKNIV